MGRVACAIEARTHFGQLVRQGVESHEPIIVEHCIDRLDKMPRCSVVSDPRPAMAIQPKQASKEG